MAHDSLASHSPRVLLTINGDQLTWTVRPKGLQILGLLLIAAGLAAFAGCLLVSVNIWENTELWLYVRLTGSCSVASVGLSLLTTMVYLALRDGWARATVTFDHEKLTVDEIVLHRSR